jgi:LacI family transcriptional regulator
MIGRAALGRPWLLGDIARALDVSLMTVSLALRNSPKVSKATRLKVRRMADKLGYRPDPEIARLMTRLHKTTQSWDRPRWPSSTSPLHAFPPGLTITANTSAWVP